MLTALSLQAVMSRVTEHDNGRLAQLTGLKEAQIERCKILLEFPEKYQNLSLVAEEF